MWWSYRKTLVLIWFTVKVHHFHWHHFKVEFGFMYFCFLQNKADLERTVGFLWIIRFILIIARKCLQFYRNILGTDEP